MALLPAFSKIFEKAFYNRVHQFFDKYKVLTSRQFGFTKGRSTQDAVLSFYMQLLENFNTKLKSAGIFFDMSRAFDLINHEILLHKLNHYGIRGSAAEWIQSYLTNRSQSVSIVNSDGTKFISDDMNISTGVPQGSILGPLLFIAFTCDIEKHLSNCHLTLYADDTSSIISASNLPDLSVKATSCVANMTNWCSSNGLVLNPSKTKVIIFSPTGVVNDFSMLIRSGSQSLPGTNYTNFLGILTDENLTWNSHTERVTGKLATQHFAVLQLREIVSTSTLRSYYFACVHSILSYGILCWGNSTGVKSILVAQKRIVRCMLRLPFQESCRQHFKTLGILTVSCIYILEAVCYVKKNSADLRKCGDINNYSTRNKNDIYIPPYRIEQINKGPFISSIRLYQKLPNNIQNLTSNNFKRAVKKLLIGKAYYTLDEFMSDNHLSHNYSS